MNAIHKWSAVVSVTLCSCAPSGVSGPIQSVPTPPMSAQPFAATSASAPVVQWTPTPDEPFRQTPPAPGAESAWSAPVPEVATLRQGMKLLVVPRPKLPFTVMYLATLRGSDLEPMAGLGTFTGEMIEQGTTTRSSLQLSDEFENLGAEHQAWVDQDSGNLWIKVLSQHFDKAVELMADMIQHPAFDKAEVERLRSQRLAAISQQAEVPAVILRNTIARVTFPGHPYGRTPLGTAQSVAKFTADNVRAFYEARFTPDQTVVVIVGDITRQAATERFEKAFSGWKTPSKPAPAVAVAPPARREIILVDRPGAPQSNIALAGVGVARTTKDFDPIMVANTILGGMFSSRLNLNLREKHSWTYGARTGFEMHHGPGAFTAGAAVDTPNTAAAVQEMLLELEKMRTAPVTDDELTLAKGTLVKSLPGRFESNGSTAGSIASIGVFGLPLDEYRTRPDRFQKVTAADVQRVAKIWFDTSKMRIFVVGDRKAIEDDLKKLKFGPVILLDADGKTQAR